MKKKKKNFLFSLIYMGITIAVIGIIALTGPDLEEIGEALQGFNIWWLFACIGSLFLYWLTDGWLLYDITSYMYKRVPFHRSLQVGIIGLYYAALTPFSTGGQPMQVVYMKRNKIPVGTGTCIVGIKFVIYELSLCTIYIVGMAVRGSYYYTYHNQAFWFAVLGFVFNLAAVSMIILSIVNKKLVLNIGHWFVRLLAKIRLIKNLEKAHHNLEKTIDEYHTAAAYISKYKLRAVGSFFISVANLSFFFLVTYLIYLSFGYSQYNIIDVFFMQACLFLAVSFIPIPGAAGASEGGFMLFFRTFFGAGTAVAMLIWRFVTYYMILITGSLLVVLDEVFFIGRKKKDNPLKEAGGQL